MSTLVSELNKKTAHDILDVQDFNERIVGAYNTGTAENGLPADATTARSLIPAGTAALRDLQCDGKGKFMNEFGLMEKCPLCTNPDLDAF